SVVVPPAAPELALLGFGCNRQGGSVGLGSYEWFQMPVLRDRARAPGRRPGNVAALRELPRGAPTRPHGGVLPAARLGVPRVLLGATQRVRAGGGDFYRVRLLLVLLVVMAETRR